MVLKKPFTKLTMILTFGVIGGIDYMLSVKLCLGKAVMYYVFIFPL